MIGEEDNFAYYKLIENNLLIDSLCCLEYCFQPPQRSIAGRTVIALTWGSLPVSKAYVIGESVGVLITMHLGTWGRRKDLSVLKVSFFSYIFYLNW